MRVQIRPAAASDIESMKGRFRRADIDELWAAAHKTPEECLEEGMVSSPLCWTGTVEGLPVAMFGASPACLIGGIGVPWMVGTNELASCARPMIEMARPVVDRMLMTFGHLVNYVDARNDKAIRWLKHLGFEFKGAEPYGLENLPFFRFEMRRG